MKLLLLYKEWELLTEFEKHDIELSDKLNMKRNEKLELDAKVIILLMFVIIANNSIIDKRMPRKALL